MGIDLRLLPFTSERYRASFDVLDLERRRELWPVIEEIEKATGRDVPSDFNSYLGHDEEHEQTTYGATLKTPYGDNLKSVLAKHLKPLRQHPAVQDNWKNKAVWAYIEELPDELPIALYWH